MGHLATRSGYMRRVALPARRSCDAVSRACAIPLVETCTSGQHHGRFMPSEGVSTCWRIALLSPPSARSRPCTRPTRRERSDEYDLRADSGCHRRRRLTVNVLIALPEPTRRQPGFDGHIAWRVRSVAVSDAPPPATPAAAIDRSHLRRLPLPAREQPQREQADRGLRDEHAPEHARVLPVERRSRAATTAGSGSARRTRR